MTMLQAPPEKSTSGEIPPKYAAGKAARRAKPFWRRKVFIFGVLAAIVVVAIAAASAGKGTPKPAAPVAAPALSAHGVVEPIAQATVATIAGGVVRSLGVRVGQTVNEGQVIAQTNAAGQTETLVAPWGGTVMGVNVQRGDTVLPGAAVAVIGDLSRYQVRTTDVDEYLIGQIRSGQQVSMTVEALDGRKLEGTVDTVALVQQTSGSGVANYPVVIRLAANDQDLRPGMTVRIVFDSGSGR